MNFLISLEIMNDKEISELEKWLLRFAIWGRKSNKETGSEFAKEIREYYDEHKEIIIKSISK